jgi:hypothetical protein
MLNLSRRAVLTGGALLGTVAIALPTLAAGSGTPANKAVAAGAKTEVFAPGEEVTILSAALKTSKPTDLILQVALECSILTDVVIDGGPDVSQETSRAEGTVKVWVELDGKIVPIQSTSTPPQDAEAQPAGNDTDKVTFCDRLHERTVTDREDDTDGIDGSRDYQRTKSANAFNWLRLNAGSGEHTVVVKASLETSADQGSSAQAVIGNRTLIIEPTKLANDAIIGVNGS